MTTPTHTHDDPHRLVVACPACIDRVRQDQAQDLFDEEWSHEPDDVITNMLDVWFQRGTDLDRRLFRIASACLAARRAARKERQAWGLTPTLIGIDAER